MATLTVTLTLDELTLAQLNELQRTTGRTQEELLRDGLDLVLHQQVNYASYDETMEIARKVMDKHRGVLRRLA